MECLLSSFSTVLQKNIDLFVKHWNSHHVRPSRHNTIAGIPEILYYLPQNSGGISCGIPVSDEKIHEVEHHCKMEQESNEYDEYFHYVMEAERLFYPDTPDQSLALYERHLAVAT